MEKRIVPSPIAKGLKTTVKREGKLLKPSKVTLPDSKTKRRPGAYFKAQFGSIKLVV